VERLLSVGDWALGRIRPAFVGLIALAMLTTVLAAPAHAGPEGTLVSRINSSRAAAGLPPVETYWDLTDDARAHSARMAAEGRIFHNSALASVTGVWQALGENVGVGWDPNELHDSFMSSGPHRANVLGDYNYVGVGVKTDDDGAIWATVIFMRAAPGLNGGSTTTTAPPTTTTTTTTTPPPADPPPATSPDPTPAPSSQPEPPPAPPASAEKVAAPKAAASSTSAAEAARISGYGRPDGAIVD
jgi:hypothetical protein